jgi:pyruvate dehydrogenase E1 component
MDPSIPKAVGDPHDPDIDPLETREWIEALDALIAAEGSERATFLLRRLLQHARTRRVPLPQVLATPYINTIPLAEQPPYQGNSRSNRASPRSCAGTRSRWWCARTAIGGAGRAHRELRLGRRPLRGRLQPFLSRGPVGRPRLLPAAFAPGVYARAYLEGRLTEEHLDNYRRETGGKGSRRTAIRGSCRTSGSSRRARWAWGRCSRSTRRASCATSQHRGSATPRARKVWAFVGDGEMDEPEALAGLSLAARERLDNLVLVVNCNLQRLDGPVRGNGSIVQELEGLFAGAGWNVIKLLWSGDWDPLFARDTHQWLEKRFLETVTASSRPTRPPTARSTASTSSTSIRSCSSWSRTSRTTTSTACGAAATIR